ncbi:MAG: hypothetical protein KTR32_35780 [Granulosicoccus sp.]|nr:hypothetical protein [Granulosicoccus sp.]
MLSQLRSTESDDYKQAFSQVRIDCQFANLTLFIEAAPPMTLLKHTDHLENEPEKGHVQNQTACIEKMQAIQRSCLRHNVFASHSPG